MDTLNLIQTILDYLPLAFLILIAFGGVMGFFRGCARSLIRTILLAVSVGVAYFLTDTVMNVAGTYVEGLIGAVIGGLLASMEEMQTEVEMVGQYISDVTTALAKPLLFSILFIVVAIVAWIVQGILNVIFFRGKRKFLLRFAGLACGAFSAIICTVCILVPVVGMINTASEALYTIEENGTKEQLIAQDPAWGGTLASASVIHQVQSCTPVRLATYFGSESLFEKLTVFTSPDGVETSIQTEVDAILAVLPGVMQAIGEFNKPKTEETGMIDLDLTLTRDALLADFDGDGIVSVQESDYLARLLAQIVHTAGNKWAAGDTFLGFNLKEIAAENNAFSAIADNLIYELQITEKETLPQNVAVICDKITLLSHTAGYVAMFSETGKTETDLADKMTDVVLSINKNNVELVEDMLTEEVLKEGQLSEENVSVIMDVATSILESVADVENVAERTKEATAINSLFTYAGQVQDGEKQVEVETLVESVLDSGIVSSVVENYTEQEDFTTIQLNAEKEAELTATLNEKLTTATEEEKATLEAIANIFNLTINR